MKYFMRLGRFDLGYSFHRTLCSQIEFFVVNTLPDFWLAEFHLKYFLIRDTLFCLRLVGFY